MGLGLELLGLTYRPETTDRVADDEERRVPSMERIVPIARSVVLIFRAMSGSSVASVSRSHHGVPRASDTSQAQHWIARDVAATAEPLHHSTSVKGECRTPTRLAAPASRRTMQTTVNKRNGHHRCESTAFSLGRESASE